jgi:tetratricopeptide (TPR) repeat protein
MTGDGSGGDVYVAEALVIAESLDDAVVLGEVLYYAGIHQWCSGRLGLACESVARALEVLRDTNDLWARADAYAFKQITHACGGRFEGLDPHGPDGIELADRLGHIAAWTHGDGGRAVLSFLLSGHLDAHAAWAKRAETTWSRAGPWGTFGKLQGGVIRFFQGEWQGADEVLKAIDVPPHVWVGYFWGARLLVKSYLGHADAKDLFEENRGLLPEADEVALSGCWGFACDAVEALVVLGERDTAAGLYDVVRAHVDSGWVYWTTRMTEVSAGIAAAAGRNWRQAEEHFENAMRLAAEIPFRVAQPESRRWYAWMLIDRDNAGDKEKARALLSEATGMYEEIGMPRHVELTEELLNR